MTVGEKRWTKVLSETIYYTEQEDVSEQEKANGTWGARGSEVQPLQEEWIGDGWSWRTFTNQSAKFSGTTYVYLASTQILVQPRDS